MNQRWVLFFYKFLFIKFFYFRKRVTLKTIESSCGGKELIYNHNVRCPLFVKRIDVEYCEHCPEYCLREDINKGFGGDYVWLRPIYTYNSSEAANCFHVEIYDHQRYHSMGDLARGSGGAYRYLVQANSGNCSDKIRDVWLSDFQNGRGFTKDINEGRGGRYLYLNWD